MDDLFFTVPPPDATTGVNSTSTHTTSIVDAPCLTVTITKHTWYGKMVHIVRKNNHICRAVCWELVIEGGTIYVIVSFMDNKKKRKKKLVSPIMLATMHLLWLNNDVCSEDDVATDDEESHSLCDSVLPKLQVHESMSSQIERQAQFALLFITSQTNSILSLI
mgnify:CR=1 FL=1